jgi:hypothetical protein
MMTLNWTWLSGLGNATTLISNPMLALFLKYVNAKASIASAC